jgi:hypothetical protein
MIQFDYVIDTIQNTKKQFVSTVVTNEKIANSLNEFIDTQTSYTKSAIKNMSNISANLTKETVSVLKQCDTFDCFKFNESILKFFNKL